MRRIGSGMVWGLALVLSLAFVGGPLQAQAPKVGSKFGSVNDWIAAGKTAVEVVQLAESLTRKDSPVDVKARLRHTFAEQKLQVSKTTLDVSMERTTNNWRGSVRVEMEMPCEVTYAIDLSRIGPEHLRVEPGKRVLYVKMPPVQVETVSPIVEKMERRSHFGWGRSRYIDVKATQGLEDDLRKECRAEARNRAEKELDSVRKTGQAALQDFLRKIFKSAGADLEVIVE